MEKPRISDWGYSIGGFSDFLRGLHRQMPKRSHLIIATSVALAAVLLSGVLPPRAQAAEQAGEAASASASATGEVRRIDAAAGRITIKHGEIKALELPAMTLVYHADPQLLAKVKPGDQIRFTAARQGTRYVVTEID